jgi:hypothetical protein
MRNLIFRSALLVGALSMLAGCVFIRSSSISDSAGTGNAVTASASDMGFVELIAPQGLTHSANQQLASQCPGGKFTDVQNELSVRDFFLVQLYSLSADAVCQ